MDDQRAPALDRIVDRAGSLFRLLHASQTQDWLTVDLTMPQLKALMCVAHASGAATSGQIAHGLGVGLSTVTGIVDRLCEHGLVARREDPEDRRITRVVPTPQGRELVERLLQYRNERMLAILSRLAPDQLAVVEQALGYLVGAAEQLNAERQQQEVA
jgi:DNA-binding MarR family transcriptional regulator